MLWNWLHDLVTRFCLSVVRTRRAEMGQLPLDTKTREGNRRNCPRVTVDQFNSITSCLEVREREKVETVARGWAELRKSTPWSAGWIVAVVWGVIFASFHCQQLHLRPSSQAFKKVEHCKQASFFFVLTFSCSTHLLKSTVVFSNKLYLNFLASNRMWKVSQYFWIVPGKISHSQQPW